MKNLILTFLISISCLLTTYAQPRTPSVAGIRFDAVLTTAQIQTLPNPSEGYTVYNIDTKTLYTYDGSAWKQATGGSGTSLPDITGIPAKELSTPEEYIALSTAQKNSDTLWIILPDTPVGYSLSSTISSVTSGNSNSFSFSFNNAKVGNSFDYTISTSGGPGTIAGYGVIGSQSYLIDGIDVSALADGTLTISGYLTDMGVTGNAVTLQVPKNTTLSVPSGYTVAYTSVDPITESTDDNVSFEFTAGEIGATYNYTIIDDASSTVTGSGVLVSATEEITGINVTSLQNGNLQLRVTLTNVQGSGVQVTDDITKNAALGVTDYYPGTDAISVNNEANGVGTWNIGNGGDSGAWFEVVANTDPSAGGSWMFKLNRNQVDGWETATYTITNLPLVPLEFRIRTYIENGNTGGNYLWTGFSGNYSTSSSPGSDQWFTRIISGTPANTGDGTGTIVMKFYSSATIGAPIGNAWYASEVQIVEQ